MGLAIWSTNKVANNVPPFRRIRRRPSCYRLPFKERTGLFCGSTRNGEHGNLVVALERRFTMIKLLQCPARISLAYL
jgi:hypothetical protein